MTLASQKSNFQRAYFPHPDQSGGFAHPHLGPGENENGRQVGLHQLDDFQRDPLDPLCPLLPKRVAN